MSPTDHNHQLTLTNHRKEESQPLFHKETRAERRAKQRKLKKMKR